MTGVSYMIPFVTVGGIFLALGFALTPTEALEAGEIAAQGSLGWFLAQIGNAGLALMVPVLGAYVAYAIGDRPALAPGFILSYLLQQENVMTAAAEVMGFTQAASGDGALVAGYLGALVAGLVVGYVARYINNLDVPDALDSMMPILIVPVFTTAILAPVLLLLLGVPIAVANQAMNAFLASMGTGQAVGLGAVIGLMMAFDMGGPVNKVAYVFGVGLIGEGVTGPMAAVMAAGMTPPLGMALSTFFAPQKYPEEMYEQAKSATVLGFSFITEGAIPYAASDPGRVIPSLMTGSAVAGAASMAMGVTMPAPHGGIFVVPLSNNPLGFLGALALGSVVTAGMVTLLKPDVEETSEE
ncbi:Fructose PTS system EIIBC or EIIC component [Candidatus Nanohalovita haloferacivicina]|nr:Fructose PTS system EIIBC or EIIC component [Candidatus Nanohalobia archaeon BNXNv]